MSIENKLVKNYPKNAQSENAQHGNNHIHKQSFALAQQLKTIERFEQAAFRFL